MMIRKRYHKCSICGKVAKWYYIPSTSHNTRRYYCDDCVPRGCSCNSYEISMDGEPDENRKYIWTDIEKGLYEYLDDNGKRFPCCEYDYDENGQDFHITHKLITKENVMNLWKQTKYCFSIGNYLGKQIEEYILSLGDVIDYNKFMMRISDITHHWSKGFNGIGADVISFYNSFRSQCEELTYKEYEWQD